MKHSLKEWFAVTRYWSFPVSVMPVVVTTAYLAWIFEASLINWLNAVLALVGIVFFHAGGNVISDWADYRSGVDNENAFAVPNLVFHKFKPQEYLKFGTVLLAIGVAIGLVLVLRTGWTLLLVGLLGALLTVGYSFFKYRALGDLTIFLNFSILPILGTTYVAIGTFCSILICIRTRSVSSAIESVIALNISYPDILYSTSGSLCPYACKPIP